jgi:hypothetical protein
MPIDRFNPRNNTVVLNHFHSVKILLFSSARSRDFDGLIGIELPVSMYTTKTQFSTLSGSPKPVSSKNYIGLIVWSCWWPDWSSEFESSQV